MAVQVQKATRDFCKVQICMTIKVLQIAQHPESWNAAVECIEAPSLLQVPNAAIPVEHFLRGLGVLVQRNFPVWLSKSSVVHLTDLNSQPLGEANPANVAQYGLPQGSEVFACSSAP